MNNINQVIKARKIVENAWGADVASKLDDLLVIQAAAELEGEAVPESVPVIIHLPQMNLKEKLKPVTEEPVDEGVDQDQEPIIEEITHEENADDQKSASEGLDPGRGNTNEASSSENEEQPSIETGQVSATEGDRPAREDMVRSLTVFAENQQAPVLEEISRLTGSQEAITDRIPLINVIVSHLTPEQAKDLIMNQDIEKIEKDKQVTIELNTSVPAIGAIGQQDIGPLTGQGVVVAIVGEEVDDQHPDLSGRVVQKRFYGQEPFGNPGLHETLIAGIVAGNGTGSGGIYRGVAPAATIWSYKLPMTGTDPGYVKAKAVLDAAADGARIINCSWRVVEDTLRDGSCVWCKAVDTAFDLGSIVVKSAGNAGPVAESTTCPANARNVIAVGATSNDGTRLALSNFGADFSSRGPTSDGRRKPEVIAPGENIQGPLAGGGYTSNEYADGTSFAAPHVAGVIALILEQHPELTAVEVRQLIINSAVKIAVVPDEAQGAGLVNARRALRLASGQDSDLPSITSSAEIRMNGFVPSFEISFDGDEYYAVEIAVEPTLFRDYDHRREFHTDHQNADFYASWAESSVPPLPRKNGLMATFELPADAWKYFRTFPKLYFRALVSSAADSWENIRYSTPDDQAESAPFFEPQTL